MGLRGLLSAGVAGLALLSVLSAGISSARTMPSNATVYLDEESRLYFAPPCISDPTRFKISTASEAYSLNYGPDPGCRDQGAFQSEDRSLLGQVLVKMGVLGELPRRWNADGSWNW